MTKTFAERCHIAQQFLPDAQYKAMLTALHKDMLAELEEQPAPEPEPDKHQEYIDSLSHDHDSEEKMLTQIHHWARQSYSRHHQSVRGQMITAADSSDNHIIWAALRWAKENPSPQARPAQQEPVAWANPNDLQNFDMKVRTNGGPLHTVPLYTTPQAQPAREWVGLTEEEKTELRRKHYPLPLLLMDATEAKLKEKNA